ncbi:MAG TPA: MgtC/SapB family protein [Egibacteraceae bacterium]
MDWEPFWRVLLAAALTLPIGLERELRGKSAGLRTHVVVGVGAAAFGYVSVLAAGDDVADRTRIAAQIVSGIGFMGAGVIFAASGRVHGLTTAAALWTSAAVGTCVGLGAPTLAAALSLVTLVLLWPLDALAARVIPRFALQERTFHVVADSLAGIAEVQALVRRLGVRSRELDLRDVADGVGLSLLVRCSPAKAQQLVTGLRSLPGVRYVSNLGLLGDDE